MTEILVGSRWCRFDHLAGEVVVHGVATDTTGDSPLVVFRPQSGVAINRLVYMPVDIFLAEFTRLPDPPPALQTDPRGRPGITTR